MGQDQAVDRSLQVMAYTDVGHLALSPANALMGRFLRLITGRVMEISARDKSHSLGEPVDQVQVMLDKVNLPIVVCIGIAAFNLVQGLSLPWKPTVIASQHTGYPFSSTAINFLISPAFPPPSGR